MNFDNYIFDFDGTLANSKQCSIEATKEAFAQFGLSEPSDADIVHYMGIPIEKSFIEMSDRFLTEDALNQLLQLLRKKKQVFVVSSKKTDVLLRNLDHLGLGRFIKEAIGSDKVTRYKPDPDGINYIIQNHHLNPARSIYIGDAIHDIQMAKAAGIKSCGVTWGAFDAKALLRENPDYILNEADEINTIL